MRSTVEWVIYFYLFICFTLLVFNALYIARSTLLKRARAERVSQWEAAFAKGLGEAQLTKQHLKTLSKAEQLTAFYTAFQNQAMDPEQTHRFFQLNALQLQNLALVYSKRTVMERAFFAYFVASFHTSDVGNNDMLAEIMLSYLDDSTVYCRENVLHALYALGRPQALEHAFEILNQRGWYHNPKLIADGMASFTGDKTALVLRLWKHRGEWEEPLNVGTVQFAMSLKDPALDQAFYEALDSENLTTEVRFALVRYFQRHPYEPVLSVLYRYLETQDAQDSQLAVAAAAALQFYPGEDTRQHLKEALHSRSWYVRHNAASSLNHLGILPEDVEEIRQSGDRYALEMLQYVTKPPVTDTDDASTAESGPGMESLEEVPV